MTLNEHSRRKIAYELLGILQTYAPNATAQALCAKLCNDVPPEDQIKVLAHALVDGLDYGNWPWVIDASRSV